MPGSSYNGLWVYLDDDMLEPDYPVSTAYSWQLRDNLAHLIDSQCQTRVSWMGKIGRADHFPHPAGYDAHYAVVFPITILSTGHLPGIRIASWLYSNDAGNTVTAEYALRWASEALFPNGVAPATNTLWSFTHTTTATAGEKFVSYTSTTREALNQAAAYRSFAIIENSSAHTTSVPMARLEIAMSDDSGDGGGLLGLQVIEYPRWP